MGRSNKKVHNHESSSIETVQFKDNSSMLKMELAFGKLISFYFCVFLFIFCFILIRRLDLNTLAIGEPQYKEGHKFSKNNNSTNTSHTTEENDTLPPGGSESQHHLFPNYTLTCRTTNLTETCPSNTYPTKIEQEIPSTDKCPEYFKWIHEDLKHWREKGITKKMVEAGKNVAYFRLIVLDGRVYVETYKKSFQTRDVFTIWGILQLLRMYPGKLPDLDLMFNCDDKPMIKKSDHAVAAVAPPMFHYCGDDESLDISFPDWSFWGWHEINIKPWESVIEDFKEGNQKLKWTDRAPYAYWKGNIKMGHRLSLLKCNSTQDWNTQIFEQKWALETRNGFRQSNVADQCTYRYKIYMEGQTWSVSQKYIQACDSMLLLVTPRYYEFFTRSLVPLKHYWPINPEKLCKAIKFATDWGNNHPEKAQEIGKSGNKFITEELKLRYIYDYMFHTLIEYAKLLKYKPTVPPEAVEICTETMVCNVRGKEKKWKMDSMVKRPSLTSPCVVPMAYSTEQLKEVLSFKENVHSDVEKWEESGNIGDVNFSKF